MLSSTKCLLTIAILVCFSKAGYAIKCYECSTSYSSECSDSFPSSDFYQDCLYENAPYYVPDAYRDANATGCMIRYLKDAYGYELFERACYYGDVSNKETGCIDEPISSYRLKRCDVCDTDYCNTGSYPSEPHHVAYDTASTATIAMVIAIFSAIAHWVA